MATSGDYENEINRRQRKESVMLDDKRVIVVENCNWCPMRYYVKEEKQAYCAKTKNRITYSPAIKNGLVPVDCPLPKAAGNQADIFNKGRSE